MKRNRFTPNTTAIPNRLFDEIMVTLSEPELRVLLVIMRKVFGWHKDTDLISNSQFELMTGLKKRAIQRATVSLREKGYIEKQEKRAGGMNEYDVLIDPHAQADTEGVHDGTPPHAQADTEGVHDGTHTKETTKINSAKRKTSPDGERSMTEYHDDELKKAVGYILKETGIRLSVNRQLKIWWYNAIKDDTLVTLKFMVKNFCHNEANKKIGKWDWISFFKYQAKRANFAVADIRVRQHAEPDDDGVPEEERQRHREAAGV